MKSKFYLTLPLCLLAACSMPNEEFQCPVGEGVGCKSVSQVNSLVNQKKLGDSAYEFDGSIAQTNTSKLEPSAGYRLWIAPYVDSEGIERPAQVETI